jgi:Family of unknown function (DUF6152)
MTVPAATILSRTILAAAMLTAAGTASAHHSFAMFDQTKVLHTSGAVKQFEFVNPHVWLHVAVVNDKGEVSTWTFEGGSPTQLVRLGWSKDDFKAGDKVDVGFRPMKDGSRGGQLMSVKLPSGQRLCSNRGCGDGTGTVLNQ